MPFRNRASDNYDVETTAKVETRGGYTSWSKKRAKPSRVTAREERQSRQASKNRRSRG